MQPTAFDDEFANAVIDARGAARRYPARGWLLVGLVLCCLAPRIWMAVRLDTVCNDAVFYIQLAERLQQGDLEGGLGRLRLNTYPPVLALLHSAGLDWALAGKAWGVALASLAVLPLYGWLRRQFNEQLAWVGCLLYAFHPKLIEWSPELIRDPTFWFFWTLSLYTSWRAAAETRLRWYVAAGFVIALALHTRFEGWSLYLPLFGWSICRQLAWSRQPRKPSSEGVGGSLVRAAVGCAAAVAMCPLLLMAINLTWLADQPRWELGNFNRLEYVALWSQATWQAVHGERPAESGAELAGSSRALAPAANRSTPAALAAPVQGLASPVAMPARMSAGRTLWAFINGLRRGFGALFGLCWLAGFACRPRLWLRRDHGILFLVAGCVAAGTWVHLWYAQETSSRYFLAVVLLAVPCAAMGCCWTCRCLERAAGWLFARWSFAPRTSAFSWRVAALLVLIVAAGAAETLPSRHEGRRREAALGRWILAEFGPGRRIVTPHPLGLLGFYAHASTHALGSGPAETTDTADVAVALRHSMNSEATASFVAAARRRGLRPIDTRRLPAEHDWRDVMVLTRRENTGQGL